ncbi:DUF3618 domain-containing protein [Nocardia grenadensis]|uniref:DUF3618 domain-containing protein n=1 Tax=Nocardia grenadensis TaxID=931537 RepID=UPI0007A3EC03|nr:DUF3618 domain-containing protein [Nocardia grenadensis]
MTENGGRSVDDDRDALRRDRDQVREELRETVDELAGKFDVRARAEESAHHAADEVRHRAGEVERTVRDRAGQVQAQAHQLLERAEAGTPAPVAASGRKTAAFLRGYPVPAVTAALAAAVVAWLIVRGRKS